MKSFWIALFVLPMTLRSEWIVPKDPDPNVIFREAQEDSRAERFEEALAKHVWFHENALKLRRSLYGVRLSFALSAWRELAKKYEPAMEALRSTRDAAEAKAKSNDGTFEVFHDAVSLNNSLGESQRIVGLFKWMDEHKPEQAKQALSVAEPALLAAKEYTLCGKYLNPENDFDTMVMGFRQNLRMSKQERFKDMKDFGERTFSTGVATLVALLVLNDRKAEAKEIREKAIKEWDVKTFQDQLDQALQGNLPAPFPPR